MRPQDLRGYRHVHLFAGIGGWAYAAQLAGWPAAQEVWTASCPCQPLSVAGRRRGAGDPRDLWHHVARLVRACRPAVIVGEQVASPLGYDWFDRVSTDLAAENYEIRAIDIPALSVNSPQRRQRLYWVGLAKPLCTGLERSRVSAPAGRAASDQPVDANRIHRAQHRRRAGAAPMPNPWSSAEWITCGDGKQRRAEPTIRGVVDGFPGGLVELCPTEDAALAVGHRVKRVALWQGYGNAVVPCVAAIVLASLLDVMPQTDASGTAPDPMTPAVPPRI